MELVQVGTKRISVMQNTTEKNVPYSFVEKTFLR